MQRLTSLVLIVSRAAERYRAAVLAMGIVSFGLVTADHAQFIELPKFFKVPLWIGIILTSARWALWEGVYKAKVLEQVRKREPNSMVQRNGEFEA